MQSKFSEIIQKARILNDQNIKDKNSPSYHRVIGLLVGLGFIIAPNIKPKATIKVDVLEAIRIGIDLESRVLEVLPAAIISFPKSFLYLDKLPKEFKELINSLKTRRKGSDLYGIPFDKYVEATNRPIKNKKRKTLDERRVPKTFRFKPSIIKMIEEGSKSSGLNCTAYIESLVLLKS